MKDLNLPLVQSLIVLLVIFIFLSYLTFSLFDIKIYNQSKSDSDTTALSTINETERERAARQVLSASLSPVLKNPLWKGVIVPKNIVDNRKGLYYKLDFLSVKDTLPIRFPTGEYTINTIEEDFNYTFQVFVDSMLKKVVNANVEYNFYILGSADSLGNTNFKKPLDPSDGFKQIDVLPRVGNLQFSSLEVTKEIPDTFRNEHLPDLRAKFLKDSLFLVHPFLKEPAILEGSVTNREDSTDRKVTIIFYIDYE